MLLFVRLALLSSLLLLAFAADFSSPSDLEAIRKTLNTYPLAIDSKDFGLLSRVFTKDVTAKYGVGVGTLRGLQAVEAGLQAVLALVISQHSLTTQVIDLHEPPHGSGPPSGNGPPQPKGANTTSYFIASQFGTGKYKGQVVYSYGRYEDYLIPIATNDGYNGYDWRVQNRTVIYMGPDLGNLSIFTQ